MELDRELILKKINLLSIEENKTEMIKILCEIIDNKKFFKENIDLAIYIMRICELYGYAMYFESHCDLDDFNLKSYLKTSGGKGYHVLVHFKNRINWEEFTQIAQNIAKLMEARWPDRYTSNIRKEKRKNKIFIDWIRNTKSASSIAPYSLRAKDKPVVSMPIKWSELDKIEPNEIDLKNAIKRLKRKDPWEDFFE